MRNWHFGKNWCSKKMWKFYEIGDKDKRPPTFVVWKNWIGHVWINAKCNNLSLFICWRRAHQQLLRWMSQEIGSSLPPNCVGENLDSVPLKLSDEGNSIGQDEIMGTKLSLLCLHKLERPKMYLSYQDSKNEQWAAFVLKCVTQGHQTC